MFDLLFTFIAVLCLASLTVFVLLCVMALLGWLEDRRWQAEYERELAAAEKSLAEDLEAWQWVELPAAETSRNRPRSDAQGDVARFPTEEPTWPT